MKYMSVIVGMFLIIILSGCWSNNEPERMLYAHGIGIDYKDGKYHVYVQIVNFSTIAKSDQPSSDVEQVEIGHASGETMEEAVFNLYHSSDERIFWGHLTFIVFSDELFKKDKAAPVINGFLRFQQTRYLIWTYVTNDSVKEVLLTIPIVKTSVTLSKLADPLNSYDQESYIQPVDFRRLIIRLDEPNHETIIPSVEVTENWETIKEKTKSAKINGGGIITPEGFKGFILGDKIKGLQWMNKETESGQISFLLEKGNKDSFASVLLENFKVDVQPVVKGNNVSFDITTKMNARVNTVPKKTSEQELLKRIREEIKKEIMITYEEALKKDIDIYRLSEHLYREDVNKWKQLEQNGKVNLTKSSIRSIDVKIRNLKVSSESLRETIK